VLRGPNLPGVPDVEVELTDPSWTIFHAVQELVQKADLGSRQEKLRRIWEPTYTIAYREARKEDGCDRDFGGDSTPVVTLYSRNGARSGQSAGSTPSTPLAQPMFGSPGGAMACTVEDVLQLLRHLYVICTDPSHSTPGSPVNGELNHTSSKVPVRLQTDDIGKSKQISRRGGGDSGER